MLGDRREAFYDCLLEEVGPFYANYDSLAMRAGLGVIFTCDILLQLLSGQFGHFGLSRSTFNILMLLRHGPPMGMELHDLGELLLVSRANITGLIDHLEHRKYVTRTVNETDRRARFARITPTGEALLDRLVPEHNLTVKLLLQDLSEKDKRLLLELLKKMRESLVAGQEKCRANVLTEIKIDRD